MPKLPPPRVSPAMPVVETYGFYAVRGALRTAYDLGEECLRLAQEHEEPAAYVTSHFMLGGPLYNLGELVSAREHLEQGVVLLDRLQHRHMSEFLSGLNAGALYRSFLAHTLWWLGFPDQALRQNQEAKALLDELTR